MTIAVTRSSTVTLGIWTYKLEFLSNYEVRLRLCNPPYSQFDDWDDAGDGHARTYCGEKVLTLTRWVISEIEAYLKTLKPPYIFYTVGFDFSRYSLHRRVGKQLEKLGYEAAHTPNSGSFYLYRRLVESCPVYVAEPYVIAAV